eukprot:TRINITY_DN2926_c0_g1_i2.p1 TRINITY_DN2926_c0_g1~~TRINITY_DN2926_c0_g1_i2.p1  ORF type:complete len:104 (-),score=14.32 TRINITY_DN2926_c0_g1_i2:52-363(-)
MEARTSTNSGGCTLNPLHPYPTYHPHRHYVQNNPANLNELNWSYYGDPPNLQHDLATARGLFEQAAKNGSSQGFQGYKKMLNTGVGVPSCLQLSNQERSKGNL